MILHGDPMSGNVYKAQLMLAHLGVEYDHVPTSWSDGGTSDAEFLRLNPNGKVPVLIDGDFVLPESNAILQYLANGTTWWPAERKIQARILQWMFFEQYSHEPYIATSRSIMHKCHGTPTPEQQGMLLAKRAGGEHALAVMEHHLASNEWFGAEAPSIGDLALYAYTHVAEDGGFVLGNYPGVQAWLQRVSSLSGHVPLVFDP